MAELKQSDLESLKNIVTEFEGKLGKQLGTEPTICGALAIGKCRRYGSQHQWDPSLLASRQFLHGPGWHVPGGG